MRRPVRIDLRVVDLIYKVGSKLLLSKEKNDVLEKNKLVAFFLFEMSINFTKERSDERVVSGILQKRYIPNKKI